MKESEMVITITKSITLTEQTETIETIESFEMVGKDGKRTLVKQDSTKKVKPLNIWKTVFKEVA